MRLFGKTIWIVKKLNGFLRVFWLNDGLWENKWIYKTLFLIGLPEPKIVHQKTKIDSLVGPKGLCVINTYFPTYKHILKHSFQEDKIEQRWDSGLRIWKFVVRIPS